MAWSYDVSFESLPPVMAGHELLGSTTHFRTATKDGWLSLSEGRRVSVLSFKDDHLQILVEEYLDPCSWFNHLTQPETLDMILLKKADP